MLLPRIRFCLSTPPCSTAISYYQTKATVFRFQSLYLHTSNRPQPALDRLKVAVLILEPFEELLLDLDLKCEIIHACGWHHGSILCRGVRLLLLNLEVVLLELAPEGLVPLFDHGSQLWWCNAVVVRDVV